MEEIKKRSAGRTRVYKRHARISWLFSILIAAFVAAFTFFVWLTPVRVSGESMAPNLKNGEVVLVDRLAKYFTAPKRGDVVLFSDDGEYLLKRIVAVGGETVEIVSGEVFIGSRPLEELGYAVSAGGDFAPMLVRDQHVFVLSDNRLALQDSRDADIGAVPLENVSGVLRFRVFPIERFTFFY